VKLSGARILIESLIENGVDTVFGYPGSAVLNIYDELYKCKDRIRHILVSHEQHAAHAADGYARSSGRAGVCIATSGPGATNLVTGIATAFVDSVPVVAITGNVSKHLLGKDSFQEVDIAGITMPIVKHNWIVEDVNDLAQIVYEAFIVAMSGRPGPVLIDIPKDISHALCEYNDSVIAKNMAQSLWNEDITVKGRAWRFFEKTKRKKFCENDIEKAVSLITASKYPVLYAGGGVVNSKAAVQLKELALQLGSPVVLSLMGMGAFPAEHPLCLGLVGMHGTSASCKAVQECDLLIAVGARFSDRLTSSNEKFCKNAKIIHIDIDPAEINKNILADTYIIGDLILVLEKLINKIPKNYKNEWNGKIEKWKSETVKNNKITKKSIKNSLQPKFIIRETAKVLGENAIIVTDVGQHQIWTAQFYPFKNPGSFLSSGGMGTMGFGLGAAIGAKIANPEISVVLFTGDGCFRMDSAEMATLVKYGLPVLIILFNNRTLGMLRQWQKIIYKGRYSQTNLNDRGPDFIKLAAAYDVQGFRVTDETGFLKAMEESMKILAGGKPALIEAVIDKDERV